MKIWCQSCTPLGHGEPWDTYQRSLERRIDEIVRPGTTAELHGADYPISGVDRFRAAGNVCQWQTIRNAVRAEKAGYDAFVMLSTNDAGFYEIRELTKIPVVFITEASLHLSCLLSDKFGYVTHNSASLRRRIGLVEQYGLAHRMVPGAHLDITYNNFQEMFENPKPYLESISQKAREVVNRGAGVLLTSPLVINRCLLDNNVWEIDGAVVLDAAAAVIKLAELMVDYKAIGINRCKTGNYAPPPTDVLEPLKKLYD
ncbi:aspartate/glutamate racemase family protein [Chloroflexota bacterium]